MLKQRQLLEREVLQRYDFHFDIAEEVASGDSIRGRPVFRNILPKLGTTYQAIVCKDLSRLGRGSYTDMGVVYDVIRDKRIFIVTMDSVYDPRNFSDLRMIRFSMFFNREEYEMTLWRLTEGKYDGAERGKWVAGTVPYGFRYDRKLQVPVPDADEARIVRLIYRLYTEEGLGAHAIAKQLRRLGIPSPRGKERWHPQTIQRMVQNPAYIGRLEFRKTQRNKLDGRVVKRPREEHIVVEDAFEGIVDGAVWNAARVHAAPDPLRSTPKAKLDTVVSELAGLITCDTCGHKLIRQTSTSYYRRADGTKSRYQRASLYCATCGYSVKYRDCETQLMAVLRALPTLEHHRLQPVTPRKESRGQRGDEDGGADGADDVALEAHVKDRQAALERRLVRAREYLLDGTLTKSEYAQTKAKVESDLADLERASKSSLNAVVASHEGVHTNPSQANADDTELAGIRNLADCYEMLRDSDLKRALLQGLFEEIALRRTGKRAKGRRGNLFDITVRLNPQRFQWKDDG